MSTESFEDADKRKMFNPCTPPDLVNIMGRNILIFKTDGFSSIDRQSADEVSYTGKYSRYTTGSGTPSPLPFLIFYDLDNEVVLDQIYGGEKYLGHNESDSVYSLVTNYYGLQDTAEVTVASNKFMEKSIDI